MIPCDQNLEFRFIVKDTSDLSSPLQRVNKALYYLYEYIEEVDSKLVDNDELMKKLKNF